MSSAATRAPLKDPYEFCAEDVEAPPLRFRAVLRRIGPGMILAASIVGSGELIATTSLGAKVGYTALWLVILSCFIKPAVQSVMGRYTIATGETGLAAFNRVPGPRWKVSWVVWAWALMVAMTLFQIGAMFGGSAQVLHQVVPAVPVKAWVPVLLVITLALLLGGGYERIEKVATVKVGLFTLLTLMCAVVLTSQPEYFSWGQIADGLRFELPQGGLATAVAVFGITGVGATELFMYPYWCVEKGYARFTGQRDDSPAWQARARGWVRVMHFDILASMIIYTVATLAFYLLGAGVLHGRGLLPQARESEMIPVLSRMYTETLGSWALPLFYLGAIATLYGTIFAATAAHSRLFADLCRLLGLYEAGDYASRLRWRNRFVWFLTAIPAALYLTLESPVRMVTIGGVAQAIMLPVVGAGALFLHHRHLPEKAAAPKSLTVLAWCAAVLMAVMMTYSVFRTFFS